MLTVYCCELEFLAPLLLNFVKSMAKTFTMVQRVCQKTIDCPDMEGEFAIVRKIIATLCLWPVLCFVHPTIEFHHSLDGNALHWNAWWSHHLLQELRYNLFHHCLLQ